MTLQQVQLINLFCRSHAKPIKWQELVPDTDDRNPAGLSEPVPQDGPEILAKKLVHVTTISPSVPELESSFFRYIAPVGQ